jgi:hypothetical protein
MQILYQKLLLLAIYIFMDVPYSPILRWRFEKKSEGNTFDVFEQRPPKHRGRPGFHILAPTVAITTSTPPSPQKGKSEPPEWLP